MKKGIPRTTSGLTLATRKVTSKNLTRLALFSTEKAATTIPYVSSIVPSIFWAPMSVSLMGKPSCLAKVGWMILTSLPESIKARPWALLMPLNWTGYCMQGVRSRAFSLAPVVNVEVAETDTGFLTSETLDTCLHSAPICCSYNTWPHLGPSFFFFFSCLRPRSRWFRRPGCLWFPWNPSCLYATSSFCPF